LRVPPCAVRVAAQAERRILTEYHRTEERREGIVLTDTGWTSPRSSGPLDVWSGFHIFP
ncbi:hypothetical protein M9458_002746, partial [Cirrhinus mrigala]